MYKSDSYKRAERKAVAFYLACVSLSLGPAGALFIYLTARYA